MAVETNRGMDKQIFKAALSHAAMQLKIPRLNAKQEAAVRGIVGENDVFVNLPIGFGKTICFQSIPFVMDYITPPEPAEEVIDKHIAIVVEPTAAIMRDQATKLLAKGICAAAINHEQRDATVKQAVVKGDVKLRYISPESLALDKYREMLSSEPYQKQPCPLGH